MRHRYRVLWPRRAEHTDAERLLWSYLRGRQVAGAKFRRQHPAGPFILDFYCPEFRLAVELDGSQHYEAARAAYLEELGIRVVRFTDVEMLTQAEAVVEAILTSLTTAGDALT